MDFDLPGELQSGPSRRGTQVRFYNREARPPVAYRF